MVSRVVHQLLLSLCVLLSLNSGTRGAESTPDFSRQIAPLLTKYCTACHDSDAAEGRFVLDSYSALLKGGEHGPALVAGDAASSRLYRLIAGQAEPRMPPEENPAPKPEEIALIKMWIDAGARGPDGIEPDRKQLVVPKIAPADAPRPVTSLAWSPVGNYLAVARAGGVELLDTSSLQTVKRLAEQQGKITVVSFSRDGEHLLTGGGIAGVFGEARLWNVGDGSLVRSFDAHRDILYGATLSPDGRQLATCGYDRRAILWNTVTGEQLRVLDGHNDALYDVAFSPNGKLVATASGDATVKIWSVATGERLDTLSQPFKEQFCVAFSPDSKRILAGGADNRMRVWKLVSRSKPAINPLQHARFAHEGALVRLIYSPDGKMLVTVAVDRTIKLWDVKTFTQTHMFDVQPDAVYAVAFSPDAKRLAVGRMDGSVEILDVPARINERQIVSRQSTQDAPIDPADEADEQEALLITESEPNDELAIATRLPLPGVARGAIDVAKSNRNTDIDLYRIECRRGQQWMLEIDAARSKSPLDSKVEVLDSHGKPVVRVQLAAVRDSYITFRGIDSTNREVRIFGWEEMDLGQFLYFQGEVSKTYRMPQGPDSGFELFPHDGARLCYFDTTAASHAQGEPCYVVQPLAPGETPVPNGLPVFPIYFENDDDAQRQLGADSRLTFVPPADGVYYIRVSDVRGFHGEDFHYTLTARRRRPDFEVKLGGQKPTISAGSGKTFTVDLDRIDGFEGDVRVELVGSPPPGFTISSPLVIEDGHYRASGVIYAASDSVEPSAEQAAELQFRAIANVNGREIVKDIGTLGDIKLRSKPKVAVQLLPSASSHSDDQKREATGTPAGAEIVIHPGQTIPALLRVERNGFKNRVRLDVLNLPFGVIVANIGLNDVLIPEGENERQIFLEAAPWVNESTRWVHAIAKDDGNQSSVPIRLRVEKPKTAVDD